ncbi:MAG: 2-oxoglutarate dehydrogenase E1 component [Deltaproteobacteria bacterium RIFCSPHIGHO2_02_FULL_44_16]|nr:MAG: 2-oxoglutarate dehydrogenase E1 component [Deltaproteobacteria bacterium RIFCSPHIGHO2_02_FULL_44_16]
MTISLHPTNVVYIEQLLQQYRDNPSSLEPTWRAFFDGIEFARENGKDLGDKLLFEFNVFQLIQAYREMGFLIADVNPLDRTPKSHPLLTLEQYHLSPFDLDRPCDAGKLLGLEAATLGDIVAHLRTSYCGPATVEFSHIGDPERRLWIQQRIESHELLQSTEATTKKNILHLLVQSETFDMTLHKRFVGQKRFSGEGNDAMIPMLADLIEQSAQTHTDEIIFGMAHRGRLSFLTNVLKKDLKTLFAEFLGNLETNTTPGDGDVKYHLGFSGEITTSSGKEVHLSLVPNPSHLEAINAVVMGMVRAKQQCKDDSTRMKTLAVLLHGDASFAGQGNVYETLNMSGLRGYTIGGTIHVIINNQIGFTTNPKDARSTPNTTDIAKMLQTPIFRVNADEPEMAVRCMRLALEYRNLFQDDVFIDLMGYRRYGHNEGDEPSFTQPLLSEKIKHHPRVAEIYTARLLEEGIITQEEAQAFREKLQTSYETLIEEAKKAKIPRTMSAFEKTWHDFSPVPQTETFFQTIDTAVAEKILQKMGDELSTSPENFQPHPKLIRFFEDRKEMIDGKRGIDWSLGEALAFGSLLCDNFSIRLSGQDVERGTFSHRHSVLYDITNNERYIPLNHLSERKKDYEVVNSLLSEFAAMGFEFGQSLADPYKLTLWEAQFGDFFNGAQVIVDQFLVSSAIKWQRSSGLVLLLPHGYEGMGPEHSSARLERFLQACAQQNIQVCNVSTPAQYFHLLRRQMLRSFRLPLVIMSPKSLLRHPRATSSMAELTTGTFCEILDETMLKSSKEMKRLILCSGKIYYELLAEREAQKIMNVPLIRIEQFYPFHAKYLQTIFQRYPKIKEIVWCQEEAQNMGGWHFMKNQLVPLLDQKVKLQYVGRPPQASVSGGYLHVHEAEQKRIVTTAFSDLEGAL